MSDRDHMAERRALDRIEKYEPGDGVAVTVGQASGAEGEPVRDGVTEKMLNAGQERYCAISNFTHFDDFIQAEIYKAMRSIDPAFRHPPEAGERNAVIEALKSCLATFDVIATEYLGEGKTWAEWSYVANTIRQVRSALASTPAPEPKVVKPKITHRIERDDFEGTVVGSYVTREGRTGVVLQQVGTRVVHVYNDKWLVPVASTPPTDTQREGKGIADIAAERRRQIAEEDWSAEHDDEHTDGSMAVAAACYAIHGDDHRWRVTPGASQPEMGAAYGWLHWPWDWEWWKPRDRRRNLVRAGALIVAEIDRLDRLALPASGEGTKL